MGKLAELHNSTKAQALAEWAVVFPVQLFITLGVIQLALVLVARNVVTYSAHMAARAELVGADPHKAAAMICSPITWNTYGKRDTRVESDLGLTVKGRKETGLVFPRPEWQGPPIDTPSYNFQEIFLPGWGVLDHSDISLLKTHTYATVPRDGHNDYVEVQVLYEFELIIPGVNWVFSTHRVAGHPHLGLLRTARLPTQWHNDDDGVKPHEYVKTVDTGSAP